MTHDPFTQDPLTRFLRPHRDPGCGRPVVLLADIDGTLVDDSMVVSARDLQAIEDFMARGHYFTLATGRGRTNAEHHMANVPSNFPAVFANGALLYDRRRNRAIHQHEMTTTGLEGLFLKMQKYYPEIMIQIYTADDIYLITDNPAEDSRVSNHEPYRRVAFEAIRGISCNKVLFGMQEENCDGGRLIAEDHVRAYLPDLRVEKSQPIDLERTPAGVSKGAMVEYIRAHTDAVIAVAGDYFNDIEMMQEADIGYTLMTSPAEVRAAADVVLDSRPGQFISRVVADLLQQHAGQGR